MSEPQMTQPTSQESTYGDLGGKGLLQTLFLHGHLNIKYVFRSVGLSSVFILKARLDLLECGRSC